MRHSFVVGVTPDGGRHPLFVGTEGEAGSFVEKAHACAGVVDGTFYRHITPCYGVMPSHTYTFDAPAASPPQTSAVATPVAKNREEYAAWLATLGRPGLAEEGRALGVMIKVGSSNPDVRAALLAIKFPPAHVAVADENRQAATGTEADGDSDDTGI